VRYGQGTQDARARAGNGSARTRLAYQIEVNYFSYDLTH
jgi:hypothetical protein